MEKIMLVQTDPEIKACFPVLRQLHENITEDGIVSHVRRLETNRYKLLFLSHSGVVKSVSGFHIGESFGWKKYLYVDDLVTDSKCRSQGYGAKLLEWLFNHARENSCEQLHLDSRVTQYATHKFYLNRGLYIGGYHFLASLDSYAT